MIKSLLKLKLHKVKISIKREKNIMRIKSPRSNGRNSAVNGFLIFCIFQSFFFSIYFFQQHSASQTAREGGGYLFNSSLPLPPTLRTLRP